MNSGQTFLYQHLKKKPLSQNTVPIYGLIFELVIKINSKKKKIQILTLETIVLLSRHNSFKTEFKYYTSH